MLHVVKVLNSVFQMKLNWWILVIYDFVYLVNGYDFVCPDISHRRLYSMAVCTPPENYACLKNALENRYEDDCYQTRPIGIGYKYVFRPGYDKEECEPLRYQPYIFWRKDLTDCAFLKSNCNEEGQLIYNNGTSARDVGCKCNGDSGYTFLFTPKHGNFCVPSDEDCTCYRNPNILGNNPKFGVDADLIPIAEESKNLTYDRQNGKTKYNSRQIVKKHAAWMVLGTLLLFVIVFSCSLKWHTSRERHEQVMVDKQKMNTKEYFKKIHEKNRNIQKTKGTTGITKDAHDEDRMENSCAIKTNSGNKNQIASFNNSIGKIRDILMTDRIDIDSSSSDDTTPLYMAGEQVHIEIVRKQIKNATASTNKCADNGTSRYSGHVVVDRELIQNSANVTKSNKDVWSPLHFACFKNHLDVVKELLKYTDIDINQSINNDTTSLYLACGKGHIEIVRELIKHSADINKCRDSGDSPLYVASANGHAVVVRELIQNSANVTKSDKNGWSPLHTACFKNHLDVVKELLKCTDIDINQSINNGNTSLYLACHEGHIEIVRELIKHSADINKCTVDGASPLHVESNNGHAVVVKELIQNSANVTKSDKYGWSPLHTACFKNHLDVVKELLKCTDIDINQSINNGNTSLYLACHEGHIEIVRELIKHSADINKCPVDGASPLHVASINGHDVVVKELIQNSANVTKSTKY